MLAENRLTVKLLLMSATQSREKFAGTGGLGKCSVCGACYIYGDLWKHESTGEHIHIGQDCAAKYELLADRSAFELEADRRKAATARECIKAANKSHREAFLASHPGLEAALTCDHPIVKDIAESRRRMVAGLRGELLRIRKVMKWSDAAAKALEVEQARNDEIAAAEAAYEAQRPITS